jgi:hypothetical protein
MTTTNRETKKRPFYGHILQKKRKSPVTEFKRKTREAGKFSDFFRLKRKGGKDKVNEKGKQKIY